ncbi:MAG TPA: HAMP domain-containing sensor histidine kinase, partial [Treponemataceae bacterium]|nr:HAMP domain-containing sensor histidine kinase [Treponemataceae bacterium]
FIIIAIPLLLLSFFIGLVFVKRALRPVKNMTKTAQKISSENLNFRLITNESGDELDNLAKTFNELFFRLERDFKRERQFTSDVSHELKTPLAVITGHANLLRRWGKSDTVQLDKSIEAIIIESKSIQKIIENLLQLSRIENGPFITYKKNLSLKKLFERLKRDFAVLASDANIEICFPAGTHDYFVYADESMLYEIVTILINNSVKYTSGSAQIVLRATVINEVRKNDLYTNKNILKESNNDIAVSVIDYGKGIDPKALPHVFERFYQYDSARTRNNVIFDASSGSGLGLSIAKALTEAMGSKVFIESPVKTCDTGSFHQGTCVTIILPASIDLSTL